MFFPSDCHARDFKIFSSFLLLLFSFLFSIRRWVERTWAVVAVLYFFKSSLQVETPELLERPLTYLLVSRPNYQRFCLGYIFKSPTHGYTLMCCLVIHTRWAWHKKIQNCICFALHIGVYEMFVISFCACVCTFCECTVCARVKNSTNPVVFCRPIKTKINRECPDQNS